MTEQYRVRVTKDHLVFSAGHFVTIGDFCERLHGHNWRVAAEVEGPLDENTFVVDFIALRDELQRIVNELDHSMLLPLEHPRIEVAEVGDEVEVRFDSRRWVFPREDCRLLPLQQTSAELIAQWIGQRLWELLAARGISRPDRICLEVEENFGQWAIYEFSPVA
ncbi:MAG: 6-pyruvoyl tetrahydropterin synthase family protein [Planctomycetaceae bacterium]|nr:6-pyruvoyl tetrahydropterin synthase family protein [Planctomycetaceae bacterium]